MKLNKLAASIGIFLSLAAAAPVVAFAKHGSDDGPGHVRNGGDDGPGHVRHGGDDGQAPVDSARGSRRPGRHGMPGRRRRPGINVRMPANTWQ